MQTTRFIRYSDAVANSVTVLAGLAVIYFIVSAVVTGHSNTRVERTSHTMVGWSKGASAPRLSGITYSSAEHTLLIAASSSCHYCQLSRPFYERVLEFSAKRNHLQVITVFPTTDSNVDLFLKEGNLVSPHVVRADFKSIHVKGTPTLLLVDRSGHIQDFWIGALRESEEATVLGLL
jgi:hypothetical protein